MKPSNVFQTVVLGLLLAGCQGKFRDPSREMAPSVTPSAIFASEVRQPSTAGVLDTHLKDVHGQSVGVSCVTCHSSQGGLIQHSGGTSFHQDLRLIHGKLSCNSCHDQDRTRLHLADGQKLDFDQSMQLCAQCHGVQHRDYTRGSHGGMNGYWDLRRGPRQRNHCLDCHAAHQPAYPSVQPVHPPKDRLLKWDSRESRISPKVSGNHAK